MGSWIKYRQRQGPDCKRGSQQPPFLLHLSQVRMITPTKAWDGGWGRGRGSARKGENGGGVTDMLNRAGRGREEPRAKFKELN